MYHCFRLTKGSDLKKEIAKKIFSTIEEIEQKYNKNFFDKIKLFFDYRKIKKLLNLNKVLNNDILKRLPYELNIAMEEAKLRQVEDEIFSTFDNELNIPSDMAHNIFIRV